VAFVKLDTRILESTLWIERECREVFITALLMAIPDEFKEPQEQLEVRSLTPTGWKAPAGWYGFVDAAGIGIVRRALVDTELGLDALERLGSTDPESRTADFEGRRMIRINGGYLILNFMKYRDKDNTAAERAKRYRDRQKLLSSGVQGSPSQCDDVTVTRDSSLAECRVQNADEKPKARAGRGSRLPHDWTPDQELINWAGIERPDLYLPREIESFRDYWTGIAGAKGVKLDWPAAFRNWIRRANGFTGSREAPRAAPSKARQKLNMLQEYRNGLATERNSTRVSAPDLPLLGSSTDG